MKKISKLLGILLMLSSFVLGCNEALNSEQIERIETEDQPVEIQLDQSLMLYVPKNYVVQDTIIGDLNKDGVSDMIILVKNTDPKMLVVNENDNLVDRNRRGILILIKKGNDYELAIKNLSCFSSEFEDGGVYFAPEFWLSIERGVVAFHYSHGRYGHWSYKFRYQNDDFELIGYDSSSNHGPVIMSETSINYSTWKKIKKVNINDDADSGEEVFESTTSNIHVRARIRLSKVKDFDDLHSELSMDFDDFEE